MVQCWSDLTVARISKLWGPILSYDQLKLGRRQVLM